MSKTGKTTMKFYFDCISPYAWLAYRPLTAIANKYKLNLTPIPVLFAGLLNAHGHLGPAEIPPKRLWLMKDTVRRASKQGLEVKPPPTHPFNPLLSLRLASLEMTDEMRRVLVGNLLDAAWMRGMDLSCKTSLAQIVDKTLQEMNQEKGSNSIILSPNEWVEMAATDESVKIALKNQTLDAVAAGVFGVPTTYVNGELFWGSESDTMTFIEDHIIGKDSVNSEAMVQWGNIKPSANRRKNNNNNNTVQ